MVSGIAKNGHACITHTKRLIAPSTKPPLTILKKTMTITKPASRTLSAGGGGHTTGGRASAECSMHTGAHTHRHRKAGLGMLQERGKHCKFKGQGLTGMDVAISHGRERDGRPVEGAASKESACRQWIDVDPSSYA